MTLEDGEVNVIKVIKTIKAKADFEAIKSKYEMRFSGTIRFGNYFQFTSPVRMML